VARWEGWWQLSERFVEEVANSTDDPEDWIAHVRRLQFPVVHDRTRENRIRMVLDEAEFEMGLRTRIDVIWEEVLQERMLIEQRAVHRLLSSRRKYHPLLDTGVPAETFVDEFGHERGRTDLEAEFPLRHFAIWLGESSSRNWIRVFDLLREAKVDPDVFKRLVRAIESK